MKRLFITIMFTTLLFGIFTFNIKNVDAATGSFSINAPSSVTVGTNFSVTFKATGSKIFYWQYYVSYSSSNLKLISGSTTIQGEANSETYGQSSVSQTLTFKALKTGTSSVSISRGDADMNIATNFDHISYAKVSKNITAVDPIPKSTVDTLETLTIDKGILKPDFSKDVLKYEVELEAGTTEITLAATTTNAKASIAGVGKITVVEGLNTLNLVVTAESGTTKTYVISAIVKEFNPIIVKIDGENYTVVRQKDLYTAPKSFTETYVTIDDEKVIAYNNKKLGTLVGLKDSKGVIGLYLYDSKKQTYTQYEEFTFGKLVVFLYTPDKSVSVPKGYVKTKVVIDKVTVNAWKLKDAKKTTFYLVYGTNVESGIKGFYQYDSKDNTLQRFNSEQSVKLQEALNNYLIVFIAMGLLLVSLIGICIFQLTKFNKLNNKIKSARDKKIEDIKKTVDKTKMEDTKKIVK